MVKKYHPKATTFFHLIAKIAVNIVVLDPGPNPTTLIYNATGSLACFESKNILF
jgi:hypothetical protein